VPTIANAQLGDKAEDVLSLISATTTVTITCSPTLGLERTATLAERVAASGRHVIPHAHLHLFSFNQAEMAVGWQDGVLGETR
jgi:hypothetical protein